MSCLHILKIKFIENKFKNYHRLITLFYNYNCISVNNKHINVTNSTTNKHIGILTKQTSGLAVWGLTSTTDEFSLPVSLMTS